MKKVTASLLGLPLLFAVACGQHESSGDLAPHSAAASTAAVPPAPQLPPAGSALTDFSCAISASDVPAELKLGGAYPKIKVKVTNKSKTPWPALLPGRSAVHAVNIAYHWIHGEDAPIESSRALLPADLGPGESVSVDLPIREVPATGGDYILKIEPLQEAVGWFSTLKGCKTETKVRIIE